MTEPAATTVVPVTQSDAPVPVPAVTPTAPAPTSPVVEPTEKMYPESVVKELRAESARRRVEGKAVLDAIGKAYGIETPPADVLALQQIVDAERTAHAKEIRNLKVENALGDVLARHGAIPDLAKPVIVSSPSFSDLDPADAKFGASLDALVKSTVEKFPQLKVTTAPGAAPKSVGMDFTSPPAGASNQIKAQLTRADLVEMQRTGQHEAIQQAYKEGRFNQLMGKA